MAVRPEHFCMASERAKWVRIFTGDVLRAPISDQALLARVRLAAWPMDRSARDWLPVDGACSAPLRASDLMLITRASQRACVMGFGVNAGVPGAWRGMTELARVLRRRDVTKATRKPARSLSHLRKRIAAGETPEVALTASVFQQAVLDRRGWQAGIGKRGSR